MQVSLQPAKVMRNWGWFVLFLLADDNRHIFDGHFSLWALIVTGLVVALFCGYWRKGQFFLLDSVGWRDFLKGSFDASGTNEELFVVEGHDLLKLPLMRNGIPDCNKRRFPFGRIFLPDINL